MPDQYYFHNEMITADHLIAGKLAGDKPNIDCIIKRLKMVIN